MKLEYRLLSGSEVKTELATVSGWQVVDGLLTKSFAFKTYKDGLVFGTAAGFLADGLNHHPDLLVGYAKVTVSVNTHDVGGLSPFDFELARRIETLLPDQA